MSKQSDAKAIQKYNPKPVFPTCSNCVHKKTIREERDYGGWRDHHSCSIGNFAVKMRATCDKHLFNKHSF